MPKRRLPKKELKKPDEFITALSRTYSYILERRGLFLFLALVIAAALAGRWAWRAYQTSYYRQAATLFAQATLNLTLPVNPQEKEKLPKAEADLTSFVNRFPRSRLAPSALLYLGNIQHQLGKYDQAASSYQRLLATSRLDIYIQALARNGLAHTLLAQKKFADAATQFSAVASLPNSPLKELALFNQARALTNAGKPAEASQVYQQIVNQFPDSPLASFARQAMAKTTK